MFADRSNSSERGEEARWLDADGPKLPFNVLTENEIKSRGPMQDEGDEDVAEVAERLDGIVSEGGKEAADNVTV